MSSEKETDLAIDKRFYKVKDHFRLLYRCTMKDCQKIYIPLLCRPDLCFNCGNTKLEKIIGRKVEYFKKRNFLYVQDKLIRTEFELAKKQPKKKPSKPNARRPKKRTR